MTKVFKIKVPKKIVVTYDNEGEIADKITTYQACNGTIVSAWAKMVGRSVSALDVTPTYFSLCQKPTVMGTKVFKITAHDEEDLTMDQVTEYASKCGTEVQTIDITKEYSNLKKGLYDENKPAGNTGSGKNSTSKKTQ